MKRPRGLSPAVAEGTAEAEAALARSDGLAKQVTAAVDAMLREARHAVKRARKSAASLQDSASELHAREAAVEAREQNLGDREQRLREVRRELAAEHAAVLQALPNLQARLAEARAELAAALPAAGPRADGVLSEPPMALLIGQPTAPVLARQQQAPAETTARGRAVERGGRGRGRLAPRWRAREPREGSANGSSSEDDLDSLARAIREGDRSGQAAAPEPEAKAAPADDALAVHVERPTPAQSALKEDAPELFAMLRGAGLLPEAPAGYWLGALESVIERAHAFSQSGAPVQWGWCRAIKSFLFVFEAANRIVVEKPSWSNSTRFATYLFEMETPMPVDEQARRYVRRLVAALSARGARAMLLDGSTDPGDAALGASLRQLLNFNGERIFHIVPDPEGKRAMEYRERLARALAQGAARGCVAKQH
ncbi:hypothetical protein WJX81_008233 [Elliptochloris bilobata]|uniref:Uncharacterized protein n=1 Tax=Elliptochloris bilobata TaxID=381761 RepID=A0AAW1QHI4_9CHLO